VVSSFIQFIHTNVANLPLVGPGMRATEALLGAAGLALLKRAFGPEMLEALNLTDEQWEETLAAAEELMDLLDKQARL
jgi:hypothetical protein